MRLVVIATILSSFAAHGVSSESIRIQGSVEVFDRVGAALAERFGARYGDVSLAWDAAGSGAVFAALFAGAADLGVSTRTIDAQELELARRLGLELKESALASTGSRSSSIRTTTFRASRSNSSRRSTLVASFAGLGSAASMSRSSF